MNELVSERSGTTLTLTLNRPAKMNALSASLVDALIVALWQARADGTRLIVLRGNGRNFSAGFDFSGHETQSEGDLLLRFVRIEQLLQAVHHAPFDTLALAHGRNFGAGVDLVGACARRIADAGSTFCMPGLRFGLVLGTRRFAQQVGTESARKILQAGETFDAETACDLNFVHAVAGQDQWPNIIAQASEAAAALPSETAARLFEVIGPDTRDADLAELVRSAAVPGLKDRIATYLGNR